MKSVLTFASFILIGLFSLRTSSAIADPTATCAKANLTVAQSALSSAKTAMNVALSALQAPSDGDAARMTLWLGANSSPGPKAVQTTLTNAIAFAGGVSFMCDADPSPQRYAYVRKSQEFRITLTSIFFDAPETGLSSKKGILVHEISHFLLVGATTDPSAKDMYGPTEAQKLAQQNPAAAQSNAENIEYFVESTADGL